MAKLMLIDGNSLTYRAFFALPTDMATAHGQVTNAVYGFTSMLINLLRDHRPDHVAVAFDRPEPTFRHAQVEEYKATREAAPDILRQQMGLVREVAQTLHIPIIEQAGFEADDIIATLATKAQKAEIETIIVTGDRDSYQLVADPYIKVLYNRRGVSDYALYDEKGIEEKTGVPPTLYSQYAALRGDTSDNLLGVPGVGEKTAAKLIMKYGGIDGIFAHLDEQTPKLKQSLADNEVRVRRNAGVMVLVRDMDLGLEPSDLLMGKPDPEEVRRLFDFLEFRSLHDRLVEALGAESVGPELGDVDVLEAEMRVIETAADAQALLTQLGEAQRPLAIAADESGPFSGFAIVVDPAKADVAWFSRELLFEPSVREALVKLLGNGGRAIAAHNAKPIMVAMLNEGIDMHELALDTQIASYLLDPADTRYALGEVLLRYARLELPSADSAAASGQLSFGDDSVDVAQLVCRHALAVDRLIEPMQQALDAQALRTLNDEIEVPLVRVLAKMEFVGLGVDVAELTALRKHLTTECDRLRLLIIEDAGFDFNINSTKQLGEVLFDRLGLARQKKTKTGYSTDARELEKLRGEHPIIEHLLEYREVEKLRSTYGEGLLATVGPGDRIRATFNQTVARTGRLSSDAPNLHNIPVRSDAGRAFRKAFVPAPGFRLLVADYNQIELRCIAHLADDPGLIAAFTEGRDVHTAVAAQVFHVPEREVTSQQRNFSKMVSYGLAYGMEAYGLGQRLGVPTKDAAEILDEYFAAFPNVKSYMEQTVREARQRGYTETLFGRRRQIPELASSNFRIRQAGERQAMNAGIQGLAADIFKVALVRLDDALEDANLVSRLVLQVHDEVIIEMTPDESDRVREMTLSIMRGAFTLKVPLDVNLAVGKSWADAKG
jgi:DNA polymerase-1